MSAMSSWCDNQMCAVTLESGCVGECELHWYANSILSL
jgi:hypothetical protein